MTGCSRPAPRLPRPRFRGRRRAPRTPTRSPRTPRGTVRSTRTLPVYRDGTGLTVRFQGPDADQTWHGMAAGIVPGDGPYEPGLLQVVEWEFGTDGETRRYSIVHPVLTSTLTDDPYQGHDPRQRERWQLFDQAVAAGRTTADLPGRLLDPGDAVEAPHPAMAAGSSPCSR